MRLSVLALLLLPGVAAAAPTGLTDLRRVATVEDDTSAFEVDTAGRLFTVKGREISVRSPRGDLLARWPVPQESPYFGTVLIAVSPAGEIFAADYQGTVVRRYDAAGNLHGAWSVPSKLADIAYDPRGSVVASDVSTGYRYADDGTYLGTIAGWIGQRMRIAGSGRRWTVEETVLGGYATSGLPVGRIGTECSIGGEQPPCPFGPGAFGISPPIAFDAGHGLIATVEPFRLQLFDGGGRGLLACDPKRIVPSGYLVDGAIRSARELLLLDSDGAVVSARVTDRRTRGCAPMPLRVTRVRAHRRPRAITYRLNRRAKVELVSTRIDPARCDATPDRFDPASGCVVQRMRFWSAAPGRAGRNRVRLARCGRGGCASRGRWLIQVRATDASNRQSAPPPVEIRY